MKTSEALRDARRLLARRGGWTTGSMARNEKGWSVDYTSVHAVSFCAIGAINAAVGWNHAGVSEAFFFMKNQVGPSIVGWNDSPLRTKREVLAAFRAAELAARRADH